MLSTLHARPRVQRAPGFPCALCFRGEGFCTTRTRERRGKAEACFTVIASGAKQSMRQQGSKSGLLRCARNDVALISHTFAISPRDAPEFCSRVPPSETEGAVLPQEGSRECRAPDAPVASRVEKNTRVSHHGHAGSPGIPRAMVLTASFALSPVTGLVCHRHP